MGAAKAIRVAPIDRDRANRLVEQWHYSRAIVRNSQLHLGVALEGRLLGVMQFGPSLDKRKIVGLVAGTAWNAFIELNRMAFSDALPRNSESRALGIALRMIRAQYPHIEWVVSFADAAQCGDGAIYRASGFILTGITPNRSIARLPDGRIIAKVTYSQRGDRNPDGAARMPDGATMLPGHMLRYVAFLNPSARARLTVPELPFSEIAARGARMYRGEKR